MFYFLNHLKYFKIAIFVKKREKPFNLKFFSENGTNCTFEFLSKYYKIIFDM